MLKAFKRKKTSRAAEKKTQLPTLPNATLATVSGGDSANPDPNNPDATHHYYYGGYWYYR
jgi:hypothetical protein